jgi:hypothetical protein
MGSERRSRLAVASSVLAAFVGTVPGALGWSVALAQQLPFVVETRFAVGFGLVLPLWTLALCVTWLARTATRAWIACGLFAASAAVFTGVLS